MTDAGVTATYTWNARNQLTGISTTGFAASFTYDSFGRRTGKTVQGVTTNFLYDGLNPVQEKAGATVTANLLTGIGIDEFFTRTDGVGVRALLPDALGSTVALGDSTGTLQTQYTYEPFGYATQTGQASTSSYKFTGREDDGSGLDYYRARYYHPRLQRFFSEDPLEFDGGDINLYGYASNGPLNWADPYGLFSVDDLPDLPTEFTDFVIGFGDAFLIPELVREYQGLEGLVNKCSASYGIGKISGFVTGGMPFVLRGTAALTATKMGHILNHNRNFRIGPGKWYGPMRPRISSPYLPGDGHYSLTTRIPFVPPVGGPNCGCQ